MKRWPASLRPSALQWVALLGIVYFALVAQAFHVIEPCGGAGGFLAALGCLEANEFGDLLAGIFAPLAFLGLGFAIYIQSQELRAQREELKATREVSEESTKYLSIQAELARIQTDNLLSEDEKKEQAEADERFDAALREFATTVQRNFSKPIVFSIHGYAHMLDDDHEVVIHFLPEGRSRWAATPRDILSKIARNADQITKMEIMGYERHNVRSGALKAAIDLLQVAKDARPGTSASKRLSANRYRVGSALRVLERIQILIEKGAGSHEDY